MAADFNGDGDLDLANTDWSQEKVSVLLNSGDGTFGLPTDYVSAGIYGGLTTADFDADGCPDIVATGYDGAYVMLGHCDGTFESAVTLGQTYGTEGVRAIGVIIRRGQLLRRPHPPEVRVLPGNGDGTYSAEVGLKISPPGGATYFSEQSLATGDVNGDGEPDLAVINLPPRPTQ